MYKETLYIQKGFAMIFENMCLVSVVLVLFTRFVTNTAIVQGDKSIHSFHLSI